MKSIKKLIELLDNLVKINTASLLIDNNVIVSANNYTQLRNTKLDLIHEQTMLTMLKEACYASEIMHGGSSKVLLIILRQLLKDYLAKNTIMHQNELMMHLRDHCREMKIADILSIAQALDIDHHLSSMIFESFKLVGFGGKITIDERQSSTDLVEVTTGYRFSINTSHVPNLHGNNKICVDNACIITIDGTLESDIDATRALMLTQKLSKKLIIFSSGYSDNVYRLFSNNSTVIPLSVYNDLSSINTLKDISIACGCRFVSTLAGDMLNDNDFSESITHNVNNVSIDNAGITITTIYENTSSVIHHITQLLLMRSNAIDDSVRVMLDARISSLTTLRANIVLKSNNQHMHLYNRELLTTLLRNISGGCRHGIIDLTPCHELCMLKQLNLRNTILPSHHILACIKSAFSLFELLVSIK